jgi:hypothetical protein
VAEEQADFADKELDGIKDVTEHAGEAAVHAIRGQWDDVGDSLLSMSESALGVVTGGVSKSVEEGLDKPAQELGFASTHDMINQGLHAAGDAIGDGLTALVGTAGGAADAIGNGLSDIGSELGGLLGGGASGDGGASAAAPAVPDPGPAPQAIDQSYDPAMTSQMPDGGS